MTSYGEVNLGAYIKTLKESEGRTAPLIEGVNITSDILSVVRNSMLATSVAFQSIIGFGIAGGAISIVTGTRIFGYAAYKIATEKDLDGKGLIKHLGTCVLGLSFMTMGGAMIAAYASTSVLVLAIAGVVGTVAGLVLYGLIIVFATYKLIQDLKFRARLNDSSIILYTLLKDEAALEEISASSSKLVCQRMCEVATSTIPTLALDKLQDKHTLVQEAKRENMKQIAKQVAMIGIALLGVIAMLVAIYCPIVWVSPLLFAVGSCLWLTVDSSHVSQGLGDLVFARTTEDNISWSALTLACQQ